MPINQIVDFCSRLHDRHERCLDCPNEECHNSCLGCLENIHLVSSCERTYNCNNIAYCYTCKYVYRYSSEIEYLLSTYISVFRNAQPLRVCSIGCGPCSELFGLDSFKKRNNLNFEINYKGFEQIRIWEPIHQEINRILEYNIEFIYDDVFEFYKNDEDLPNIIILNYVLSDILRHNSEYFQVFINNICALFQRLPSAILIINDINLGRGQNEVRYHYKPLIDRLQQDNNIIRVDKFHFTNSQRPFFSYGVLHDSNTATMNPPQDIINKYSPWLECRSAQCVIFKRQKDI